MKRTSTPPESRRRLTLRLPPDVIKGINKERVRAKDTILDVNTVVVALLREALDARTRAH
jgi:hypothetical protein